jgi:hypothetical protein
MEVAIPMAVLVAVLTFKSWSKSAAPALFQALRVWCSEYYRFRRWLRTLRRDFQQEAGP